jgi:hypothetical protein
MKTPKEILLARHKAVEPKLDEIRRDLLAESFGLRREAERHAAFEQGSRTPKAVSSLRFATAVKILWRELILPRPRAWATVAALWVVIAALKLSTPEAPHAVAQKSSASPEILAEVRQQKLLFAELVGVAKPQVVTPMKATPPQPRSDRQFRIPIG